MASSIASFILSPRFRTVSASASLNPNSDSKVNPNLNPTPKLAAAALVLTAAAASVALLRRPPPSLATTSPPQTLAPESSPSPLTKLLATNSDAVAALRSLLYQTLDDGDDAEALKILSRLISAQPQEPEWKFLAARLHNEHGNRSEARRLFEEILADDPLCFEALFENAVLMDQCGEGNAVIERLKKALEIAKGENNNKAARDVRLIMAQIQYLQKNVEEALSSYEELAKEDPKDYRPYFCQGVILSMLERNKEAREKFAKYHELSPKKFEVDAYLQTPLSRMRLFGTEDSQA